ncbi:MAG TPA: aromatic amino acid ammonia-lyase [Polyangiales bacterium]
MAREVIRIDQPVSSRTVARIARGGVATELVCPPEHWEQLARSHQRLRARIEAEGVQVYGVTTGFGEGARKSVDSQLNPDLQSNLLHYLDCSLGELAPPAVARATLLLRIISLAQGYSAVSPALIRRLIAIHDAGYAPAIPVQGSLGASGDLIPLATIGQCIRGLGEVYGPDDRLLPAMHMLQRLELSPFEFADKDALGLVNGTSFMTALACLALVEFGHVLDWSLHAMGALFVALRAHPSAFSRLVNERAKSHPGQTYAAQRLRELAGFVDQDFSPQRAAGHHSQNLQDPYSIRCTPQVLGPIFEIVTQAEQVIDREVNSCNDNPLLDPDTGWIASGGNFYGGAIAMVMDQLAWAGSHLADLQDRQILLLMHDRSNRGLPADLTGAGDVTGADVLAHHGLKGLHQHASALASEIVRLAVPSSIFSRSAESHNQDKISLGTHAARNFTQQLSLLADLTTLHAACAVQALDLRHDHTPAALNVFRSSVREHVPFVDLDRPLRADLLRLRARVVVSGPG